MLRANKKDTSIDETIVNGSDKNQRPFNHEWSLILEHGEL
jgi:hypothetical protein